jgi:hypothetical protein
VHAAGVELHDAVGIGEATIADARILRVKLVEVDGSNHRIEHVLARHHLLEGDLDPGVLAAILVAVAVGRGDHHRRRLGRSAHGG